MSAALPLLAQVAQEAPGHYPIWRFYVLVGLIVAMIALMLYGSVQVTRLIKGLRGDLSFVRTAAQEKEALIAELDRLRERAEAADEVVNRLIKTLGLRVDGSLRAMIAPEADLVDVGVLPVAGDAL